MQQSTVQALMRDLCVEANKGASDSYLQVRLKQVLKDTRHAGLLKGLFFVKIENTKRYVYNVYLAVCGLSLSKRKYH